MPRAGMSQPVSLKVQGVKGLGQDGGALPAHAKKDQKDDSAAYRPAPDGCARCGQASRGWCKALPWHRDHILHGNFPKSRSVTTPLSMAMQRIAVNTNQRGLRLRSSSSW